MTIPSGNGGWGHGWYNDDHHGASLLIFDYGHPVSHIQNPTLSGIKLS
jgi:hypothetical protein